MARILSQLERTYPLGDVFNSDLLQGQRRERQELLDRRRIKLAGVGRILVIKPGQDNFVMLNPSSFFDRFGVNSL